MVTDGGLLYVEIAIGSCIVKLGISDSPLSLPEYQIVDKSQEVYLLSGTCYGFFIVHNEPK